MDINSVFAYGIKQFRIAIILLLLLTLLTGFIYPWAVMLIAQTFFPQQAAGSFIVENDHIIGSALIGQSFTQPGFFWGRPSATTPFPYNAKCSSGSNSSPANLAFLSLVKRRVLALQAADPGNVAFVPVDLVTASGSGLDPDISPYAAFYQVPRVAKANHISTVLLQQLITDLIQPRTLGLLGERRVNVLNLNRALIALMRRTPHA